MSAKHGNQSEWSFCKSKTNDKKLMDPSGLAVQPRMPDSEARTVQEVLLPVPKVEGGAGGGREERRRWAEQGSLRVHWLTTLCSSITVFP